MLSIIQNEVLAKLPVQELCDSLRQFLQSFTAVLPDARLRTVAELMVQGVVTSQSPIVTQIARGAGYTEATVWPTCKRAYRFLANERFNHRTLLKGLYGTAQAAVAAQAPDNLVIAVDPANFEKPYTQRQLEAARVQLAQLEQAGATKQVDLAARAGRQAERERRSRHGCLALRAKAGCKARKKSWRRWRKRRATDNQPAPNTLQKETGATRYRVAPDLSSILGRGQHFDS